MSSSRSYRSTSETLPERALRKATTASVYFALDRGRRQLQRDDRPDLLSALRLSAQEHPGRYVATAALTGLLAMRMLTGGRR